MKKLLWGILLLGILCCGCKSRDFEMDWDKIESMTTETKEHVVVVPTTEAPKELSPFVEPLMEMVESGEYTSFYCVDIDHDEQNEVVLVGKNKSTFIYLDYVEGNILQKELTGINEDLILNKKGYFQSISEFDFAVISAYVYDAINNMVIEYNRGECKHNGKNISEALVLGLLNTYGDDGALDYPMEETAIKEYTTLGPVYVYSADYKLFDFNKIEEVSADLNLMQKALLGEVQIYDTKDGKMKWISEVLKSDTQYRSLYNCDLDSDGIEEVILEDVSLSILHEIDGVIYRYEQPYSFMMSLFEDGSIEGYDYNGVVNFKIVKAFTQTEMIYEYVYQVVDDIYYKEYSADGECVVYTDEELAQINEQYKRVKKNYNIYDFDDVLKYIK